MRRYTHDGNGIWQRHNGIMHLPSTSKTECTDCLVLLWLFQRPDPLIGKETKMLSILGDLQKIISIINPHQLQRCNVLIPRFILIVGNASPPLGEDGAHPKFLTPTLNTTKCSTASQHFLLLESRLSHGL